MNDTALPRTLRADGAGHEPPVDLGLLPGLLGYHLRLAQMAVFEHFAASTADLDLSPGLFAILVIVEANPGLRQTRVAEAARIDRSTLVPALDRLEARGLVERRAASGDRRSKELFLTDAGSALLGRAKRRVRAHERAIAASLETEDRTRLMTLLDALARTSA